MEIQTRAVIKLESEFVLYLFDPKKGSNYQRFQALSSDQFSIDVVKYEMRAGHLRSCIYVTSKPNITPE